MVDLDSNPTKLIEIVAIGKQLLITRGSLRPFLSRMTSPNILPLSRRCSPRIYPELNKLNIMGLHRLRAPSWPL